MRGKNKIKSMEENKEHDVVGKEPISGRPGFKTSSNTY